MLDLLEKFTPDNVDAANDEGVVAIEYVLVAAAVAAGVIGVFSNTNLWNKLVAKLAAALP